MIRCLWIKTRVYFSILLIYQYCLLCLQVFGAPLVEGFSHFPRNYTKSEVSIPKIFKMIFFVLKMKGKKIKCEIIIGGTIRSDNGILDKLYSHGKSKWASSSRLCVASFKRAESFPERCLGRIWFVASKIFGNRYELRTHSNSFNVMQIHHEIDINHFINTFWCVVFILCSKPQPQHWMGY